MSHRPWLTPRGFFLFVVPLLLLASWSLAGGAEPGADQRIDAHLNAGEFGPALQLARQANDGRQRDAWLGQIADAQLRWGARRASLQTAYDIQNDQARSDVMSGIASRPMFGGGARGGAALADFDSLIELITSTIAPDSWDEVGGPGAIEPFPGGVYVDSAGVLKRVAAEPAGALADVRSAARSAGSNRQVHKKSPLRKVSLTRLERHLQMRWALGQPPDEAMQRLAGLQRIKYLLFYPDTRDIVLAGPAGGWTTNHEGRAVSVDTGQPVLQLDDLVVVLRNAHRGDGRFGCSITPLPDNLAAVRAFLDESAKKPLRRSQRQAWLDELKARLGNQEISVFGIDPRTRVAQVLVEADYHMKLVGLGLAEGTAGVTSYLDSVRVDASGSVPPLDVLRWWFTLNYDHVRTTEARDAFELLGPGVKVLSENELLTERGERVHTGESDELNRTFAHSFTRHYAALAAKYPIYAELRNVFDLALVAALVRGEDLATQIDWQMKHLADAEKYHVELGVAPRQVASVINHRVVDRRHIIVGVSGGVAVNARQLLTDKPLKADDYGLMQASRTSSDPQRVPRDAWWWD